MEKHKVFRKKILTIIEDHRDDLPPYEIAYFLISTGVSLCFATASTDFIAMKTIIASVSSGIVEFEQLQGEASE